MPLFSFMKTFFQEDFTVTSFQGDKNMAHTTKLKKKKRKTIHFKLKHKPPTQASKHTLYIQPSAMLDDKRDTNS